MEVRREDERKGENKDTGSGDKKIGENNDTRSEDEKMVEICTWGLRNERRMRKSIRGMRRMRRLWGWSCHPLVAKTVGLFEAARADAKAKKISVK